MSIKRKYVTMSAKTRCSSGGGADNVTGCMVLNTAGTFTMAGSMSGLLHIIYYGPVKVSTGVLQLEKLSAGDASNRKSKYKR